MHRFTLPLAAFLPFEILGKEPLSEVLVLFRRSWPAGMAAPRRGNIRADAFDDAVDEFHARSRTLRSLRKKRREKADIASLRCAHEESPIKKPIAFLA
jgi:hypothetical protein